MAEKSPAFQLYVKEFLSDANQAGMSLMETGAYARLMCFEWNECGKGIPDDPVRCARMVGATATQMHRMWDAIRSCFRLHPETPGRLIHPRLEIERQKQAEFRRRQSDKGKASAERRLNHGSTTVESRLPSGSNRGSTERQPTRVLQPEGNSPISDLRSASSEKENTHAPPRRDEQWEQFKAAYPAHRRHGGFMANQRFLAACETVGFETLMHALEKQKRSDEWHKFAPSLEKWLEKEMWIQSPEDESQDSVEASLAHLRELDRRKAERS